RAQSDQLTARLAELDSQLAGAPGPDAVRGELAAVTALQRALAEAATAVRAAREAHRRAVTGAEAAEEQLRAAWRDFDAQRDALAGYGARGAAAGKRRGAGRGKGTGKATGTGAGRLGGPPRPDRDDLVGAWQSLADWAHSLADALRAERDRQAATATAAHETS